MRNSTLLTPLICFALANIGLPQLAFSQCEGEANNAAAANDHLNSLSASLAANDQLRLALGSEDQQLRTELSDQIKNLDTILYLTNKNTDMMEQIQELYQFSLANADSISALKELNIRLKDYSPIKGSLSGIIKKHINELKSANNPASVGYIHRLGQLNLLVSAFEKKQDSWAESLLVSSENQSSQASPRSAAGSNLTLSKLIEKIIMLQSEDSESQARAVASTQDLKAKIEALNGRLLSVTQRIGQCSANDQSIRSQIQNQTQNLANLRAARSDCVKRHAKEKIQQRQPK